MTACFHLAALMFPRPRFTAHVRFDGGRRGFRSSPFCRSHHIFSVFGSPKGLARVWFWFGTGSGPPSRWLGARGIGARPSLHRPSPPIPGALTVPGVAPVLARHLLARHPGGPPSDPSNTFPHPPFPRVSAFGGGGGVLPLQGIPVPRLPRRPHHRGRHHQGGPTGRRGARAGGRGASAVARGPFPRDSSVCQTTRRTGAEDGVAKGCPYHVGRGGGC